MECTASTGASRPRVSWFEKPNQGGLLTLATSPSGDGLWS